MYTHYVNWSQQDVWKKKYPPEIEFLYSLALPVRENRNREMHWNWFVNPGQIQINIYSSEIIVLFKLKYSNDTN
jgi:hypothetical protein